MGAEVNHCVELCSNFKIQTSQCQWEMPGADSCGQSGPKGAPGAEVGRKGEGLTKHCQETLWLEICIRSLGARGVSGGG
jgi:hypothetical protein